MKYDFFLTDHAPRSVASSLRCCGVQAASGVNPSLKTKKDVGPGAIRVLCAQLLWCEL